MVFSLSDEWDAESPASFQAVIGPYGHWRPVFSFPNISHVVQDKEKDLMGYESRSFGREGSDSYSTPKHVL